VQRALTAAQGSLINSPTVPGAIGGAIIIGEIAELFTRR
jgi:hypothetical protein